MSLLLECSVFHIMITTAIAVKKIGYPSSSFWIIRLVNIVTFLGYNIDQLYVKRFPLEQYWLNGKISKQATFLYLWHIFFYQ